MTEPWPLFRRIFLDLYEVPPRQGPGNRARAERPLAMCAELPPSPKIIDPGCGARARTFRLPVWNFFRAHGA